MVPIHTGPQNAPLNKSYRFLPPMHMHARWQPVPQNTHGHNHLQLARRDPAAKTLMGNHKIAANVGNCWKTCFSSPDPQQFSLFFLSHFVCSGQLDHLFDLLFFAPPAVFEQPYVSLRLDVHTMFHGREQRGLASPALLGWDSPPYPTMPDWIVWHPLTT